MKKHLMATGMIVAASLLGGCATTKDLAQTLRYSDNKPVGVKNIQFVDLQKMKRGTSCTVNFLYLLPVWGDGSIITAADKGNINTVQLIGESGRWYFPFNTDCTVVFGDGTGALPESSRSAASSGT